MIHYKIRHKVTGWYSKGGTKVDADGNSHYWSAKGGKVWNSLGQLRSHITSHLPNGYRVSTNMDDWEVVAYELVEQPAVPILDIIDKKHIVRILSL
jgi:hypothetical protein